MHYLISSGLALAAISCLAAIARSDYRNNQNLKTAASFQNSPASDPDLRIPNDRNDK